MTLIQTPAARILALEVPNTKNHMVEGKWLKYECELGEPELCKGCRGFGQLSQAPYEDSAECPFCNGTGVEPTPPKGIEAGKSLEDVNREAELRYPVLTHSNPNDSPYKDSNKAFVNGALYASQRQGWINTNNQPNSLQDVLISHQVDGWISIGYYSEGQDSWFNSYDNDCPCHPTHYQYLPQPPSNKL